VTVPTLDGKISLNIAPQSQTGQKLRVKGRGLPGKTEAGDLFVILKVVMPDKITAEMEKLWGELAAGSSFDPRANMKS